PEDHVRALVAYQKLARPDPRGRDQENSPYSSYPPSRAFLALRAAIAYFVNGAIRGESLGGLRINVRANTILDERIVATSSSLLPLTIVDMW
ncbi:MAG: hypothetical protein L0387_45910, partial [Acidobacteria bacterium]|nr:hypothetical protein [Acidobacteriota bacterium]MCI0724157.1 hypothetical protein [Acidobacteriota bacterium]